jgi:GDP-L-fucose synthase
MVLLEAARIQFGREWISLISTNVYGKSRLRSADEEHVIPALLRKFHDAKSSQSNTVTLLGDGSPIREFLHADDLASAIHFVVNNHLYENPVLNVSSHDPCTIRDLAEIIKKITGFQGIYNFSGLIGNGAEIKLLDGSQLHDYGWSPEVSLQDGICDVYRTGLL